MKNIHDLLLDVSKGHKPKTLILGTLYSWLQCDKDAFEHKLNQLRQVKHSSTTRTFYRTVPYSESKKYKHTSES